MDIDGDALLGLIEKGGSELAAQLIPMLDTVNQLLRETHTRK